MPMRTLFADSFYWIALIFPRDAFHTTVVGYSSTLLGDGLVTTDEVLTEFLNHFAGLGPYWRQKSATLVHCIRNDPRIIVLGQTRADFDAALALYESRLDKEYSLVDCRSMTAMKSLGVTEVLTNDRHFAQEGFTVLFR
jgi:predicted nucleic acid-binding protein